MNLSIEDWTDLGAVNANQVTSPSTVNIVTNELSLHV